MKVPIHSSVSCLIDGSVDRDANISFKFNPESEFVPILGLVEQQLKGTSDTQECHHAALLSLLASELSVAPAEIHNFEL